MTVRFWNTETIVNATMTNAQVTPAVATLLDGTYVVAWSDNSGVDADIRFQRYDAGGNPLGDETKITSSGADTTPVVQALDNGGFSIAFHNADGTIYTDGFTANGVLLGAVVTESSSTDQAASYALPGTGSAGEGIAFVFGDDIRFRLLDNTGAASAGSFVVNTTTAGNQVNPDIIELANGGYVVAWATNGAEVRARLVDSAGNAVGAGDFLLNSTAVTGFPQVPTLAPLADGGFVATWTTTTNPYPGYSADVRARIFDAAGNPVGNDFLVNTRTALDQGYDDVVGLLDGGFLVVWYDFSSSTVRGQQFDATGGRLGHEFAVSSGDTAAGFDRSLSATLLADGRVSVTWSGDNGADGVHMQILDPRDGHVDGTFGNDTLYGGAIADQMMGLAGNDKMYGQAGGDQMFGGSGNDTLDGGKGDDTLDGGDGNDSLIGGAGEDTVSYSAALAGVTVNLATLTAQATGGSGSDTLSGVEDLIGSRFNDTLTGTTTANELYGGAGLDTLKGDAGDDYIDGGAGNDTIDAGAGNDTIIGGDGLDTLTYATATAGVTVSLLLPGPQATGGSGTDTLSQIERLTGSAFNDSLTGDGLNNSLTGGNGADTLSGGAANDILTGGGGLDTLTGGTGNDTFSYAAAIGDTTLASPDLITDFTAGDKIDLHFIDADTATAGDQAFHVGATGGHTGDIVVSAYDAGNNRTVLDLYVNNDATPDARIWLTGDHHAMVAGDFIL